MPRVFPNEQWSRNNEKKLVTRPPRDLSSLARLKWNPKLFHADYAFSTVTLTTNKDLGKRHVKYYFLSFLFFVGSSTFACSTAKDLLCPQHPLGRLALIVFLNVMLFCQASLDPRARFPWERGSWETYWHFSELIRRGLIYISLCTLSKLSIQIQNTYDISVFAQMSGITSCCFLDVNHENYNFLDCDWFKKKTPVFH